MDLEESESSALESVDDNTSVTQQNSSDCCYDSTFVAGMDLEKDEKPMIISSSAQRGQNPVENDSKKHRGGVSVEVNSRFSYEEGDTNGETSRKKDGEELYSEELDPLREAIGGILTLQESFEKELEQFSGIGKEPIGASEGASEGSSEIVTLVNDVEQLETKLEETRSMLEAKESHIRELESTTNQETVVEDSFRQRIESEIEYLIYSRSIDNLNTQVKSIEEQEALAAEKAHETLNRLGEVETKAANLTKRAKDLQKDCMEGINGTIKKSACKTVSCFVIQLVLLLTVVLMFLSQLSPESDIIVVPT